MDAAKRSPDSFELLEKLGEGGMGQVYKARDKDNDQIVAIKFLIPGADAGMMERLRHEAREHATLHHPNVVRLLEFLSYEDHDFLVMEYLGGGNLRDFINARLPLPDVVETFAEICAGLEYIHRQGLVHRDLKPENILFSHDSVAKIADLGLVRRLDANLGLTNFGQIVGTTRYLAPEQVLRSEVTPAVDLYSVGISLFEALTGETPFQGDNDFALINAHIREVPPPLRTRRPQAPASLEELVAALLEKSPDNRPRSAGQVRELLLQCLEELKHPPKPSPRQDRVARSIGIEDLGEVVLSMSQQIWNPMNGVLGMAQLLQGAPLPPDQRVYLEALVESAESLRLAFRDLLDFARLHTRKLRLDPVPTDLRGLVNTVRQAALPLARSQSAGLFCHVDVSVPDTVRTDPLRLHQVLFNLVTHALRVARNSTVSVLVQREHDQPSLVSLKFAITVNTYDSSPQETRELFLPRLDSRRGDGLTLFLTSQLAEALGGRCWADSAPGRGTTYTATLKAEACGELPSVEPLPSHGPLSILLADDQRFNQTLAKFLLESRGHRVQTALNGLEALEALTNQTFDLILMDVMMPEMDGITATRAIREKEKGTGRRTPIVALTALDKDEFPDECQQAGMDSYVAKPIDEKALFQAIAQNVRRTGSPEPTLAIDLEALRSQTGGSQQHADMLLQVFLDVHGTHLSALENAFRGNDLRGVVSGAQNLWRSLEGIAAQPAAQAAQSLEHLAREGRAEAALHARRQLLQEIDRLVAMLGREMPHLRIPG